MELTVSLDDGNHGLRKIQKGVENAFVSPLLPLVCKNPNGVKFSDSKIHKMTERLT